MEKQPRRSITIIAGSLAGFLWLVLCPLGASAASLSLSPARGNFNVGETINVTVMVGSPDRAINAVQGVVTFPKDRLELLAVDRTGSISSLWVTEPVFSNALGTANFESVILNPGFTGANGRILTLRFRAKAAGLAAVNFSNGAVLANDGEGTNVLQQLTGAQLTIGSTLPPPAVPPPATARALPPTIPITSTTHPDEAGWYASSEPIFNWELPSTVTAVRLLYDRYPTSRPIVYYRPPVDQKQLTEIKDGVWYFHLEAENSAGRGSASHFRFQIDSVRPSSFTLEEHSRDDLTLPRVEFTLVATDELSGLDRFEVRLDGGEIVTVSPDPEIGRAQYQTPILPPGEHTLVATAFDRAGNSLTESRTFIVTPLDPPVWESYPTESLPSGEPILLSGRSYPGSRIIVNRQAIGSDLAVYETMSDSAGRFSLVVDESLPAGSHRFAARVERVDGAQSGGSETVAVLIEKTLFGYLGRWLSDSVALIIILLAFIALLFALFILTWLGAGRLRRRVHYEAGEAELALHRSFVELREDLKEQVNFLERARFNRTLTAEELKILERLRRNLDRSEAVVEKEIRDLRKL